MDAKTLSPRRIDRRGFLRLSTAAGASVLVDMETQQAVAAPSTQSEIPVTGDAQAGLAGFDDLMRSFLTEHEVPGASLALARAGRLVYARGFGHADVAKKDPVQPDALFRIASVSKPLTAVAALQLVEKGKLSLDEPTFAKLKYRPHLEPGASVDPRLSRITVRHLFQHRSGWDRAKSFDPIGRIWDIAKSLQTRPPIGPEQIIRYMMGKPLDYDPGERFAYSNLGYLVLGRHITAESRQPYEEYVRQHVLAPLGIKRPRLGKGPLEQRAPGEVRYYDRHERTASAVVGRSIGQKVPVQYGGDNLDGYEAHGGWIASAVDLVRFASAFLDPTACPLLKESTFRAMIDRPEGLAGYEADRKPKAVYYGCGWTIRPVGARGGVNLWHGGLIAGTSSQVVRRADGLCWSVLFNTDRTPDGKVLSNLIDPPINRTAGEVKTWPQIDLFSKYL